MATGERIVLVPVNGTAGDERAIHVAILLTKRENAAVSALYVVEVPQELPLDAEMGQQVARGQEVLAAAAASARHYGREVEIELLQARVAGPAIVDEALEREAGLVVMSTSVRRKAGEISVGRTTIPYVLKNAPCEVIVCRRSLEGV